LAAIAKRNVIISEKKSCFNINYLLTLRKVKVNKLLISGLLIFSSLNCFSTCIAIYIAANGHIYVAADSKRTFLFDDDKTKFESICKIHNVGDKYFAISGFDDAGLLNAGNTALKENADFNLAINDFCTIMAARYQYLMQQTQQYYPEKLQKFLNDGLAQVCFFGFVDGQPKVEEVQFTVRLKKNKIVIDHALQPVAYITVIGISKDIDSARPGELPDKQTMLQKPELYVEELVEFEAKRHPLSVSEPIDLMELKPDGATWIKKNKDTASTE